VEKPLRILHLEDNDNDAVLIRRALVRSGLNVDVERVSAPAEFEQALKRGGYDLIISDNRIPGYDGMAAFKAAQEAGATTPFMFVTGTLTEERMLAAIEVRMPEYVSKSHLDDLGRRVRSLVSRSADSGHAGRLVVRQAAFETLLATLRDMSRANTMPALIAAACHGARHLIGADGATFVLREGNLCHYVEEDTISPLWKGRKFPMKQGIAGWVMMSRQPALIENVYNDPRVDTEVYRDTYVNALAMVPVRSEDPIGAIGVYWPRRTLATTEEASLLVALAEHAAVAMERLQHQLQASRAEAEHSRQLELAREELQNFSRTAANDLRTPLRAIAGFAEMLLDDGSSSLSGDGRNCVQRIVEATSQMGGLIDEMSQLARITQADLHEESVDMGGIARRIIGELRARDPERQVEVTIAERLQARGDTTLLSTAVEQLLRNAWRFTASRAHGRIEFGQQAEGPEGLAFFVRDNGVGFDMRYADKLFLPFERLHSGDERLGAGVGLATVQRAIRKHGGRVWAHGAPDRGATFYFTLPGRLPRRGEETAPGQT